MVSEPYTLTVHDNYFKSVCHSCFAFHGSRDQKVTCEDCESAWYCNEGCRDAHYSSVHHVECQYLKKYNKLADKTPVETKLRIRTLLRLLIKRRLELDVSDYKDALGAKFEDVESLLAHEEDSEESISVYSMVKKILPESYIPEKSRVLKLISRSECNQFGLWSEEDDLMGVSLHPSASFFNHSCVPNCFSEWEGEKLIFKTLYPVTKGSELTISYIDAHHSTKKRQRELQASYHFECDCPRCFGQDGIPRSIFSKFYQVHLQCPVGPGLMRLETNLEEIEEKDNIDLPIPNGYEVRTCMTCSFRRLSRPIPTIEDYINKKTKT